MNDAALMEATRAAQAAGINVLQAYRLAPDEDEHVRRMIEWFELPRGAVALDVGCGIGEVARLVSRHRPDLWMLQLNLSGEQLKLCTSPRIRARAEALPIADESVDAVLMTYVLGHVDAMWALHEVARVLKPGGAFCLYDLTEPRNSVLETALDYVVYPLAELCGMLHEAGLKPTAIWACMSASHDHMRPVMDEAVFAETFGAAKPLLLKATRRN